MKSTQLDGYKNDTTATNECGHMQLDFTGKFCHMGNTVTAVDVSTEQ